MLSLSKFKNISGRRVLVRCDFDVPLTKTKLANKKSAITISDDSRLRKCLPTIQYLLKKKARIILTGHLGRPMGEVVPGLSLSPIAKHLEKLLRIANPGLSITFIPEMERYLGSAAKKAAGSLVPGQVVMLENLRFSDREEANCRRFAAALASLADVYVNESFATVHRAHASVAAITSKLPSCAGFGFSEEIEHLSYFQKNPRRPLVVIIGGAKIETKLPVIKNFIDSADCVLIGGAVANDFLKAAGCEVGRSLVDEKYLPAARQILNRCAVFPGPAMPPKISKIFNRYKIGDSKIILPLDVKNQTGKILNIPSVGRRDAILDIGPRTIKLYTEIIKLAGSIIWNGPLGKFEQLQFRSGTLSLARAVLSCRANVVAGGGDTGEIFRRRRIPAHVFLSAGGGAMLEFLSGKTLPGLKK